MKQIKPGRWTAEIEGDFVVFLIGARVNRPWKLLPSLRDLGGRRAMQHMLDYLMEHPEKGLLGYESVPLHLPVPERVRGSWPGVNMRTPFGFRARGSGPNLLC